MATQPERPGQSKFCSQCGHRNRRTAKVCVQCGHSFKTDKKWCPHCGAANNRRAKVCIQCGQHFRRLKQNAPIQLQITEAPITQNPDAPLTLPDEFTRSPQPDFADGALPVNLEGEPAPDLSDEGLDILRDESSDNLDAYERLIRSLQGKHPQS